MTRLIEADICDIAGDLAVYDTLFKGQTGHSLEEIAMRAAGGFGRSKRSVAIIPVTAGQGLIGGFTKAIASILDHCLIPNQVMKYSDVAGLQAAYDSGCDLGFMADDSVFSAFGLGQRVAADNGLATGRGYAAALLAAMENQGIEPAEEEILVIGLGPVGRGAVHYLDEHNIPVVACDLVRERAQGAVAESSRKVRILGCGEDFRDYRFIIDATDSASVLADNQVGENTIIAAPGMPLGMSEAARKRAMVIFNPLELGVLTMYFSCLDQWGGE